MPIFDADDWTTEPFLQIFSDKTGGQTKIKKSDYRASGVLPIIDQGSDYIGGYTNNLQTRSSVKLPCILFGDHTRLFKYVDKPFAIGADGVKVLEVRKDIHPRYAYYFLNRVRLPDNTGYSRHYKYLKRTTFCHLSFEEQRRIATILDKADAVRRKRQESIRLTEEFLKSVFLDMFGDPVTNPKGWKIIPLGQVIEKIESGWSPKCDTRLADEGEWGVLKLGAVTSGYYIDGENKALLSKTTPRRTLEVLPGDLLFSRKNTYELVGATAYVYATRRMLMISDLIFRLKLSDNLNVKYLWQVLSNKTTRQKIRRLASGTAGSMPNVSKSRLRTLLVPVPPLHLQEAYSEIVEKNNSIQSKYLHRSDGSDNLFNSLVQRAFKGEL
ncbi:MAG: restriction endonuclease subunit S [Candidatus Aegiribacteria sp.]|nr:restriction endonuclease subunit S [Candidatus Aegiribacteria sp.]